MQDQSYSNLILKAKKRDRMERRDGIILLTLIALMFILGIVSIWTGNDFVFKAFATVVALIGAVVLKIRVTH
jgi:peptidoglycan/LPS O-acetylase OafA/YrhL